MKFANFISGTLKFFVTVGVSNVAIAQLSMFDVDVGAPHVEITPVRVCPCGVGKMTREPEMIHVPLSANLFAASICAPCLTVLENNVQVGCIAGCRHALNHCSELNLGVRIGSERRGSSCEAYGAVPMDGVIVGSRRTCRSTRLDRPGVCFVEK